MSQTLLIQLACDTEPISTKLILTHQLTQKSNHRLETTTHLDKVLVTIKTINQITGTKNINRVITGKVGKVIISRTNSTPIKSRTLHQLYPVRTRTRLYHTQRPISRVSITNNSHRSLFITSISLSLTSPKFLITSPILTLEKLISLLNF